MGVWGLCPQKIFQKINVEIAHFQAFLQAKNKMVSSAVSARHYPVRALEEGGYPSPKNYMCKMFLYKNNFSSFENIWGGPGPPGPHGHDATVGGRSRPETEKGE